jgi:predicted house-cleaning noncanonical NTP pyrophosphatase (MazG superfamily)
MIRQGELVFMYFFDIGGEVQPKELEEKLTEYGKACRERVSGSSWIEDGIRVSANDPIEILGEKCGIEFKVFSIGGLLVKITVPIKNKNFAQTLEIISKTEDDRIIPVKESGSDYASTTTTTMADFAKTLADKIREDIKAFITSQYTSPDYQEWYRLILVREGDGREILGNSKKEIVGLIRKEPFDRLCIEEVEEIVSNRYSYRDDFFIADIRGAFALVKNLEAFPVSRAVELYLLQKLQLRVYDSLLDDMLGKSYDILQKAESKANRELGERINDIHLMRLELLEIVSAMRVTKGSLRTRIFYSLCETIEEVFEVQDLANSVTRKIDRLGEVYTMVYDSLQNTRFIRMDRTMRMLEGIIVVLIVIEIILVLIGKL